ncbi:MAG: GDP-mannose 4,6-dehydratase [Euryarchaeota archaeon]|nr:GDP-mannose 4,6-dehydratase [Euryarchaeota archaeon]
MADRVFVTGATGFLGSHLVDCLTERGTAITALVRNRSDLSTRNAASVTFLQGDLTHPFSIIDATTVFHLAAISHVGHALKDPRRTFETNTAGTVNVLEAIRCSSTVQKLVFVSTAHVYGPPRYLPIDEAHPLQAHEPYAASKLAAEAFVSAYGSAYGLPVAIARLFNVYGPRQHPDFVIPSIINQALVKDALSLGNLTPTRDFTYVDDVIDALIQLATVGKGVYNVGSGVEVSIETLVTLIARILDKRVTTTSTQKRRRPNDVEIDRMWADNSRIRALGWCPRVGLTEGLRRTIGWFKQPR